MGTSELQIDPEQINRYVAERIIESSIGEALQKAIDDQIATISKSYDNPLKHVVASALQREAAEYLKKPEIRERLRKAVEDKLTDELIGTLISQLSQRVY